MSKRKNILAEKLQILIDQSREGGIYVREILQVLAGRGHAVLLILFSLPFCQPIQIPGFSTPFGLLLAFIGLRIAFGHKAWIPRFILDKKVSAQKFEKIAHFAIKITDKLRFLTKTRLSWIALNPWLHIAHGLCIALLSLTLALPIPIPLTNIFIAFPILFFGLGLLEDDGLLILLAYALTFLCGVLFYWLAITGAKFINF